jgi:hypothetical protein
LFGEPASFTIPDMGGLVASGEGTATGNPNEDVDGPRLNPRLGKFGVVGGGLVADVEGAEGAVPLLNSAHRGHFRFVSAHQGGQAVAWFQRIVTYSCAPFVRNVHIASVRCYSVSNDLEHGV